MTEPSAFKLIVEDDEGRRSVVPVEIGEVKIGRLEGNTVRLNERNVSRRHARFIRDNGSVFAEDLDSYNGVWINGTRIQGRQEVHDGDLIRIGDFQLELRGEGLAARSEETTQRTNMAEVEATQPSVSFAQSPTEISPVFGDAGSARDEPTAIIRGVGEETDELVHSSKAPSIAGDRAKLVCVSSEFAGREFEIHRAEMVIGRTDENEIPINHRSVSRHHAKLIISGRKVKIVDLGSANGTLVNGEEYTQVELKRGDLIELGHVKFRFVAAGEDYVFSAEEQAAIQRGKEGRRSGNRNLDIDPHVLALGRTSRANKILFGAIVVLLVAIFAMVIGMLTADDDEEGATASSDVVEPGAPTLVSPAPEIRIDEVEQLLSQAQTAVSQRQWTQAQSLIRQVLASEPTNARGLELRATVESELRAQESYEAAVDAINNGTWSEAWNTLQEIPSDSVYAKEAGNLLDQVRAALVTERVNRAEKALAAEDFNRASTLADEIEGLEPEQPEIVRIRQAVEEGRRRRVNAAAKTRTKTSRTKIKGTPPTTLPTPAVTESAETYYSAGRNALRVNQYQQAIDHLTKCLKADKKYCLCLRAMGIAYARLGNGPKAYRYYKQYLKSCPNAQDAAQVRTLLQQYENAQ